MPDYQRSIPYIPTGKTLDILTNAEDGFAHASAYGRHYVTGGQNRPRVVQPTSDGTESWLSGIKPPLVMPTVTVTHPGLCKGSYQLCVVRYDTTTGRNSEISPIWPPAPDFPAVVVNDTYFLAFTSQYYTTDPAPTAHYASVELGGGGPYAASQIVNVGSAATTNNVGIWYTDAQNGEIKAYAEVRRVSAQIWQDGIYSTGTCSINPESPIDGVNTVIYGTIPGTGTLRRFQVALTATVSAAPVSITDNGAGLLAGTGITGTIDYVGRSFSLTFSTAPDNGSDITFTGRSLNPNTTNVRMAIFNDDGGVPGTKLSPWAYAEVAGVDPADPEVSYVSFSWDAPVTFLQGTDYHIVFGVWEDGQWDQDNYRVRMLLDLANPISAGGYAVASAYNSTTGEYSGWSAGTAGRDLVIKMWNDTSPRDNPYYYRADASSGAEFEINTKPMNDAEPDYDLERYNAFRLMVRELVTGADFRVVNDIALGSGFSYSEDASTLTQRIPFVPGFFEPPGGFGNVCAYLDGGFSRLVWSNLCGYDPFATIDTLVEEYSVDEIAILQDSENTQITGHAVGVVVSTSAWDNDQTVEKTVTFESIETPVAVASLIVFSKVIQRSTGGEPQYTSWCAVVTSVSGNTIGYKRNTRREVESYYGLDKLAPDTNSVVTAGIGAPVEIGTVGAFVDLNPFFGLAKLQGTYASASAREFYQNAFASAGSGSQMAILDASDVLQGIAVVVGIGNSAGDGLDPAGLYLWVSWSGDGNVSRTFPTPSVGWKIAFLDSGPFQFATHRLARFVDGFGNDVSRAFLATLPSGFAGCFLDFERTQPGLLKGRPIGWTKLRISPDLVGSMKRGSTRLFMDMPGVLDWNPVPSFPDWDFLHQSYITVFGQETQKNRVFKVMKYDPDTGQPYTKLVVDMETFWLGQSFEEQLVSFSSDNRAVWISGPQSFDVEIASGLTRYDLCAEHNVRLMVQSIGRVLIICEAKELFTLQIAPFPIPRDAEVFAQFSIEGEVVMDRVEGDFTCSTKRFIVPMGDGSYWFRGNETLYHTDRTSVGQIAGMRSLLARQSFSSPRETTGALDISHWPVPAVRVAGMTLGNGDATEQIVVFPGRGFVLARGDAPISAMCSATSGDGRGVVFAGASGRMSVYASTDVERSYIEPNADPDPTDRNVFTLQQYQSGIVSGAITAHGVFDEFPFVEEDEFLAPCAYFETLTNLGGWVPDTDKQPEDPINPTSQGLSSSRSALDAPKTESGVAYWVPGRTQQVTYLSLAATGQYATVEVIRICCYINDDSDLVWRVYYVLPTDPDGILDTTDLFVLGGRAANALTSEVAPQPGNNCVSMHRITVDASAPNLSSDQFWMILEVFGSKTGAPGSLTPVFKRILPSTRFEGQMRVSVPLLTPRMRTLALCLTALCPGNSQVVITNIEGEFEDGMR